MKRWTWVDCLWIALLSALVYWAQSLAWPLSEGRDYRAFLVYFTSLGDSQPVFPDLMLYRTPGTSLFIGIVNAIGGATLLELSMALMFVSAIVSLYLACAAFNRTWGIVSALCILAYPPYGALYHFVNSDGVFAWQFAVWLAGISYLIRRPSIKAYAALGVWTFLMCMVRPVSQVLLWAGLLALLDSRWSWKKRLIQGGTYIAVGKVLLVMWALTNLVRYGEFTVSRGGNAFLPLNKFFIHIDCVRPDAGPASAEMAKHVEERLLTREPYTSRNITIDSFFSSRSSRMMLDLKFMCDEVYGRKANYAPMQEMAKEALKKNLPVVVRRCVTDMINVFTQTGWRPKGSAMHEVESPLAIRPEESFESWKLRFDSALAERLTSQDDQPIPISTYELAIYRSEEKMRQMFELEKRVTAMNLDLPKRQGSEFMGEVLYLWAGVFPLMWVWLAAGLMGVLWCSFERCKLLGAAMFFAGGILTVSVCGINLVYQYRIPFDALFIIWGTSGFVREGFRKPQQNACPLLIDKVNEVMFGDGPWNQAMRYLAGGVWAYAFATALTFAFHSLLNTHTALAYGLTQCIVLPVNFALNRWWVFRSHAGQMSRQAGLFAVAVVGFRVLDWLVFVFLNCLLGVPYALAIFLSLATVYPVKFLTYRMGIFRHKGHK